jgi:hypothetical protein
MSRVTWELGGDYPRSGPVASAAIMLLVAGCMTDLAQGRPIGGDADAGTRAAALDGSNTAIYAAVPGQVTSEATAPPAIAGITPGDRLVATLEGRLPLAPRSPADSVICSTVEANLTSAAFAAPSATDPDIDSAAAVAANPVNSNPDILCC